MSGHETTFFSFSNKRPGESLAPLPQICVNTNLLGRPLTNLSKGTDYFSRLTSLLSGRAYTLERFRSDEMRMMIEARLRSTEFDFILSDGLYALQNIPNTGLPIVLNCHNVEYLIVERYSLVEKNPLKKLYAALEASRLRGAEIQACKRTRIAMVCSAIDQNALRDICPSLPSTIVPNAVDADYYKECVATGTDDERPTLLFLGGMDWFPNRDAVEYFVRNILPAVRAEFPRVCFTVAGRNPPPEFVARLASSAGIEFTGTVPDMRPYLAAATLVVVPLRMGSGTRIKILEACAAGKAVVSTSVGAEGLELEPGREILLADKAAEFARGVVQLLRDSRLRQSIADAGRRVILERYSRLALKSSLDAVISSLNRPTNLPAKRL